MATRGMQIFRNDWNKHYVPGRGLMYSLLIHEIVFFASLTYSILAPPRIILKTPEEAIQSADVLYLPQLGGGSSGGEEGKSGKEGEGQSSSSAPAKGITFRGPQYIKSNPPNPDNALQTIMQPALVNPPKLLVPLQVPNVVHLAKAPELKPPTIKVRPSLKDIPVAASQMKPVLKAEPELISTPIKSEIEPMLPLPVQQAVQAAPTKAPLVVTPEERVSPPPVLTANATPADQPLAVLNAIQINARPTLVFPGEKQGSFEVSPDGTGTAADSHAKPGTPNGTASGLGGNATGKGRSPGGIGAGTGRGTGTAGLGAGGRGTGPGSGRAGIGPGGGSKGNGPATQGTAPGSGAGSGHGNGNGSGTGPGSGAGSGPGDSPFPGIQVIGGEGSGLSGVGSAGAAVPAHGPRNYDLSIVASGGSGGGLKDFGVFRDEAVYTVYIDVSDVAPGARSFILQYALYAAPRAAELNLGGVSSAPSEVMLEPPYALVKEVPDPSTSGSRKSMVVLSGVITRQGKFESGRILQSASAEEGRQWITTLAKWSFKPAMRGGAPVTLKVVLGIPAF